MSCDSVHRRLSAHRDGELGGADAAAVDAHLAACSRCAARWREMSAALDLLADATRLQSAGEIASRVFDRLDLESRRPGLALLFRPIGAARPLILPSLVPAVVVLASVVAVAVSVHHPEPPLPPVPQAQVRGWMGPWGTESNPLVPTADVSAPRAREGDVPQYLLDQTGEGSLFLETVVARDGSVSTVNLIGGDSEKARAVLDGVRRERFEPGRFRGRPVAVSMYRLISRMEVRAPVT